MLNNTAGIQHIFVLMLENRSFDHMLGFSGIMGRDAETGAATAISGLKGTETNSFNGKPYGVSRGASNVMPHDPAHEFPDVLLQLCGPGASYLSGGAYPAIQNSGFAQSYGNHYTNPGDVMSCYDTAKQLPALQALAQEFVVCDNWHASMPGPTWPNRLFVHAASSGGLDHSPSVAEIVLWESLQGFSFKNGTIFDALQKAGIPRRLYAGDDFPLVSALKGISLSDIRHFSQFASGLSGASYDYNYVLIEPSYDALNDYKNGDSQHPLGDVTQGEVLIKATYEAIRNSPLWDSSLLVIVWDEHGGFYDGGAFPSQAVAPGDTAPGSEHNQTGFTFQQYGARVPAVVISPRIPKNLIDHRLYDHSSIPATIEALCGLKPLTARDAAANSLHRLISLSTARTDAPTKLPNPTSAVSQPVSLTTPQPVTSVARPQDSASDGNVPAVLHAALRQDLEASPADQRGAILARAAAIKTRQQASQYLDAVRTKVRAVRATPINAAPGTRGAQGV